ncbi:MAG: GGDEF domain-containing protein [Xanthobacteraceae bacterium]|nr:GGDEF domain-containing protein [Xanthobacteraceae bacterium]
MTLAAPAPHRAEDRVVPFPNPAPAPNAGQASSDAPLNVRSEQIRLLRQHPSLILLNLVNALLVIAVLWPVFPRELLLGWYALLAVVIPVRLVLVRLGRIRGWTSAKVAGFAVAGSAATGVIWGLLAWPILTISESVYPVFLVFVLGGMSAGAVLLDAAYLPAFAAFVVPILAPATIAFAMRGDAVSLAMGLMLAAFALVQAVVGWRANCWIIDTLRLQAQRENLTADLYRTTAELTRREAILRIMANHDQLTGLFNRYYLLETLGRELSRARRLQMPVTVAILDIDHFKDYNDNFGHEAGDEVLRTTAATLKDAVRATDIVCRYGGEEFLIVFLDSAVAAAVPRLGEICKEIKQRTYVYAGSTLPSVAMSVGVAEFPQHGRSVDALIRAADRALYAAKKAGRDRIEVFS